MVSKFHHQIKTERNYVLETTGPGYLTTKYHDYTKTHSNHNITLLYPDLFDNYNPLMKELSQVYFLGSL